MHISDKVKAELVKRGFEFARVLDNDAYYSRTVATGGAFGRTVETVRMDSTGRWLERVDGWNAVERDVDLRCYDDADKAVHCVLA